MMCNANKRILYINRILTTVMMMHIVVDKSRDNAKPHSISFFTTSSTSKKILFSERDQDRDTKKEQALSIPFSQSG